MALVLLIEDDDLLREEASEYLRFGGYEVVTAQDGMEGVEFIRQYMPDIIVCDVTMPRLDGYGVLLELRSAPDTLHIPFIFLTARVEKQDVRYGMTIGADDYLTKPFSFEELTEAIEAQLKKKAEQNLIAGSEMQTLRQQLDYEREQGSLYVSMVSHDLKGPIAAIMSSADLLLRYHDKLTEERRNMHLQLIKRSSKHATALLDDLITFGKVQTGMLKINSERFDLWALIRYISDDLNSPEKPRTIQQQHDDDRTHWILGDERLIAKAVTNLLSNAMKYSEQDSEIIISTHVASQSVQIAVQDFGIGIPDEDQDRLFQVFARATNVGMIVGTGLGLAIVKLAADAHGGTITCESKQGYGSRFILTIPQYDDISGAHSQEEITHA